MAQTRYLQNGHVQYMTSTIYGITAVIIENTQTQMYNWTKWHIFYLVLKPTTGVACQPRPGGGAVEKVVGSFPIRDSRDSPLQ